MHFNVEKEDKICDTTSAHYQCYSHKMGHGQNVMLTVEIKTYQISKQLTKLMKNNINPSNYAIVQKKTKSIFPNQN